MFLHFFARSSCAALGLAFALVPASLQAGEAELGKCVGVDGALLFQDGVKWRAVKPGDDVPAGVAIIALPKAELKSANGAVGVSMMADIGQRGPFPVLESAISLNTSKGADLDLGVQRGIILLTNMKKEGAAKVKLRFRGETWSLELKEPGTKVGVEVYSRHVPHETVFKEDDPTTNVVVLVVEGKAFLDTGKHGSALRAPPGAAFVLWDSVSRESSVTNLDKLPPSIKPKDAAEEKLFLAICERAKPLGEGKIAPTIEALLKSGNASERRTGVTALGALDRVDELLGALADPFHADSREHAILVLRHWLGRGPGQLHKLNKRLTEGLGYTPVQAKVLTHLLVGFTEQEKRQQGGLATLVELLDHSLLPVRELAHWHLVRLHPAGKDIVYDAAAPEPARQRAIAQWQKALQKQEKGEK